MRRWTALAAMLPLLGGCVLFRADPTGCEAVADRDPIVKEFLAKGAGTLEYLRNHDDEYKLARNAALQRCERDRGVIPAGGGVEPYKRPK